MHVDLPWNVYLSCFMLAIRFPIILKMSITGCFQRTLKYVIHFQGSVLIDVFKLIFWTLHTEKGLTLCAILKIHINYDCY